MFTMSFFQVAAAATIQWWVWLLLVILIILLILLLWWLFRRDASETPPPIEHAPKTPLGTESRAGTMPTAPATPDDLKIIEGIGPKIEIMLNGAGISTFAALASTESSRLAEILLAANLRIADPTTWPEQARLAAEGKMEELQAYQDRLKGGRKV